MKTLLIVFCTVFLIGLISSNAAEWKSPWKTQSEINLYSLINKKYEIIEITSATMGMGMIQIEMIYLQKGEDLYRCSTAVNAETKEEWHECELCQNPTPKK